MRSLNSIPVAFFLLASTFASAQYTVGKITFKGQTPYTSKDLEAASGLKPGDKLDNAGMQAVAQKLIDTGAFDDLQFALDGPVKSINCIFTVKPVEPSHILHTSFSNFIWFTPDEIKMAVHQSVPLYNGTVPESGSMQQSVQDALVKLLATKNITAVVSSIVQEPSPGIPYRNVSYRIETPKITLHSLVVKGASGAEAAAVAKRINVMIGTSYEEGQSGIGDSILDIYRNQGYYDAALSPMERQISPSSGGFDVSLTTSVTQGDQYRVASVHYDGTPILSADAFAKSSKLHPGDIASQLALLETLSGVRTAYFGQGYLDAIVHDNPQPDHATHQVAYNVTVTPGEQYHLSQVRAVNLNPQQQQQFDANWKLKPGDVYNEIYISQFLKNNTSLRSFEGYSAAFKTEANPETHQAVLIITFQKGGTLTR